MPKNVEGPTWRGREREQQIKTGAQTMRRSNSLLFQAGLPRGRGLSLLLGMGTCVAAVADSRESRDEAARAWRPLSRRCGGRYGILQLQQIDAGPMIGRFSNSVLSRPAAPGSTIKEARERGRLIIGVALLFEQEWREMWECPVVRDGNANSGLLACMRETKQRCNRFSSPEAYWWRMDNFLCPTEGNGGATQWPGSAGGWGGAIIFFCESKR